MTWQSVGSISVGPADRLVPVGAFTLAAGDDTLWVRITQQSGDSPWPYGFGLLTWRSVEGRELGTIKVYGHPDGETYRLGVGLSPVERTGSLYFEARSYNLRWIRSAGINWSLAFEAQSGQGQAGGGGRTTVSFPATDLTADRSWSLALPNALARLDFR